MRQILGGRRRTAFVCYREPPSGQSLDLQIELLVAPERVRDEEAAQDLLFENEQVGAIQVISLAASPVGGRDLLLFGCGSGRGPIPILWVEDGPIAEPCVLHALGPGLVASEVGGIRLVLGLQDREVLPYGTTMVPEDNTSRSAGLNAVRPEGLEPPTV